MIGSLMFFAAVLLYPKISFPIQEESQSKSSNEFAKASLVVVPATEIKPAINVNASAAGAYDETGREVFGWQTKKKWPTASLTKLMTAYVAFNKMHHDEKVTMTADVLKTEGTSGDFSENEQFVVEDLIKATLLVSSNDAAAALTTHYGQSDFLKDMNQTAFEIGMKDTNFSDSTGLSVENQSTVEDLARLTEFISSESPEVLAITRKKSDIILEIRGGKRRVLNNINVFSGGLKFIGGKTGSTPEAGGNLISVFDSNGPKIVIVLGAEDRFAETEKILKSLSWL